MMTRRGFFVSVAAAAVLAAACGNGDGPSADEAEPQAEPKTFVLVHGAWQGGWSWRDVARPLRASGHRVYTPTQTGLGERSHLLSEDVTLDVFIEDVVNVLEWEDLTDVVLVGHSFGGVTITGVADRVPERIRRLVYVDAAVLQDGQSVLSLTPPETADARRQVAQESSGGVSLPVPEPSAIGVTDEDDVAWLNAKMTPHPFSVYEEPLRLDHPVGNDLPATYLAATAAYPVVQASRAFAQEQPDWQYREVEGSHYLPLTAADELVEILEEL